MVEQFIRDQNFIPVAGGVSNTNASIVLPFKIDSTTGRLLTDSTSMGTVTSVSTGTGLTGGPITSTGTISLSTALAPMATLTGNSLKVLRVNAGETAVEYVTAVTGTVTSVTSANADISVATTTTTPVLTLNSATTATASTIVKRDANANIFVNNYFANLTSTVSAGGTTVLTIASSRSQTLTGSSAQTFQLPDATTLPLTHAFNFNNNSSSSLTITNAGTTSLYVIPAGGFVECFVTNIGTANGVWDFHALPPATVTWGSGVTGLVFNTALTTTPTISAGISSAANPSFVPQRGSATTGYGGDSTNLYGSIGGSAVFTATATNFTTPGTHTGTQLISNVATGTAPLVVTSTTPVANLSIGGTASNLSGTPALPNGTTATTQAPADNSTKLASTAYVDAAVLGQNFKEAALVATTANLVGVYVSGVFTYTATGVDTIDGVALALGNRVLVKNQTTTFQNGIYSVTTAGAIGVAGVLTRTSDANTSGSFKTGDSLFVVSGTANSNTTWAYTGIDSPNIGTDTITYAQTAGQGTVTSGNGITVTGLSVAINTAVTADLSTAQSFTNKNLTGAGNTFPTFNQDTTGKSAKTDALNSATTVVNVSSATAPTSGQVLTATSGTAATWQTPATGGTPGGSTTQLQYNNAGAFGGISTTTTDGTTLTTTANTLGTTVTSRYILQNTTASTSGVTPQISPALTLQGTVWAPTPGTTVTEKIGISLVPQYDGSGSTGSTLQFTDSGNTKIFGFKNDGSGQNFLEIKAYTNSFYTQLVAGNPASTIAVNLPSVAGTLATLAGTETLTNKTLTSPTLTTPALGTPSSGTLTSCTGLPAASVVAGTFGTGAYTMDTSLAVPQIFNADHAIAASGNAATVTRAFRNNVVTNNSAATLTITMSTTSAAGGDMVLVQILDFSAAAQTITWVNTENSTITAPVTSNGSTTLPLTVGFKWNTLTSKWRCIALA